MNASDGIAVLMAAVVVWLLVRSMFRSWLNPQLTTPIQGKFQEAERWLAENGYQIVRRSLQANWSGYLDTVEIQDVLSVDFIVRKEGRNYAVKIGPSSDSGQVSRDLRDKWYRLYKAFDVDGILCLDLDGEVLHTLDFEVRPPAYIQRKQILKRAVWMASGVLMTFAWLHGR